MEVRRKEPAESLNYGLDWSARLEDGETVTGGSWTATPAGLTTVSTGHTDTITTVRVSGGDPGVEYRVEGTATTSAGNTLVDAFAVAVAGPGSPVTGERYCTVGEARAAGATGTTQEVEEAIVAATERVDAFTGDYFTPRLLSVVATVGGDGRAMLPYRVTTPEGVTTVEDADTGTALGVGLYRVFTSATPGEVDAVGIGRGWAGTNVLVVGLEPWAERPTYGRVRVTGLFGWGDTPPAVEFATAHLAADIAKTTDARSSTGEVDPEGNVVPVVPPFASPDPEWDGQWSNSTGSRKADALLVPYRRTRTLTGV